MAMKLNKKTGNGAMEEANDRASSKFVQRFSKLWSMGEKWTIFLPLVDKGNKGLQVMTASTWGHRIDGKALGIKTFFAPTTSEMVEGRPVKPDVLYHVAGLFKVLLSCEKISKQLDILNNTELSKTQKAKQNSEVEKEFDNRRPIVGRLEKVIMTEAIAVPFIETVVPGPEGEETTQLRPNWKKAVHCRIDLSDARISAIDKIINTEGAAIHQEVFVEITQEFDTKETKSESGRDADPKLVKMEDSLLVRYPDAEKILEPFLMKIPDDGSIMHRRTREFAPVDIMRLVASFSTKFSKENRLFELSEDDDKEALLRGALTLTETLKVKIEDPGLREELLTRADEIREEAVLAAAQEKALQEQMAPTIDELYEEEVQRAEESMDDAANAAAELEDDMENI